MWMQLLFSAVVPAWLPGGQVIGPVVNDDVSCGLFCMLTRPAGCGHDAVPPFWLLHVGGGDWELESGAPSVLNNTPEEAVVSFDATVLFVSVTANASSSDTPAPSQPATLLTMILLVTFTWYQFAGMDGKRDTSVPLTA